jgi:hypothetical protein
MISNLCVVITPRSYAPPSPRSTMYKDCRLGPHGVTRVTRVGHGSPRQHLRETVRAGLCRGVSPNFIMTQGTPRPSPAEPRSGAEHPGPRGDPPLETLRRHSLKQSDIVEIIRWRPSRSTRASSPTRRRWNRTRCSIRSEGGGQTKPLPQNLHRPGRLNAASHAPTRHARRTPTPSPTPICTTAQLALRCAHHGKDPHR